MPELPDVTVYVERLDAQVVGERLERVDVGSPFVLRSVDPPLSEVHGLTVTGVSRLGKRIVLGLENDLYIVMHLMIAGRLRWRAANAALPKGNGLAAFRFAGGTLVFSEASKKKRASMHVVRGDEPLREFDRGGLEVLGASAEEFADRLRAANHTLKRALTDPNILSGIGNAYSDEILFHAQLSPFRQTQQLSESEMARLHDVCVATLTEWTERLRAEVGGKFPDKVTAFRPEMAVHGKFKSPCPVCSSPIQRIVYAENEANYCAKCQTGGRLLADRALSRLLKKNWPKTLEALESARDAD